MKPVVLDTHAFVFYVEGRGLGDAAKRALRQVDRGRRRAYLPAIVPIELALLRERGRVAVGVAELAATLARNPEIRVLPLDLEQAREFVALVGVRDPFDRIVVAAARTSGGVLLTADVAISRSGLVEVEWD